MITSKQFDQALEVIMEYRLQMENKFFHEKAKKNFVNIQKEISINTFIVLQTYFKEQFNEHIDWNSLKKIDLEKLETIDFSLLRMYRGFGKISENKLKKLIVSISENLK
jgi:hypothetical protein